MVTLSFGNSSNTCMLTQDNQEHVVFWIFILGPPHTQSKSELELYSLSTSQCSVSWAGLMNQTTSYQGCSILLHSNHLGMSPDIDLPYCGETIPPLILWQVPHIDHWPAGKNSVLIRNIESLSLPSNLISYASLQ